MLPISLFSFLLKHLQRNSCRTIHRLISEIRLATVALCILEPGLRSTRPVLFSTE
jgi:hypothetical protein